MVRRLKDAGIAMNGQIVLCRGINDGEELEYSLKEFEQYLPQLQSVSVVPVGLTKYRKNLPPLVPFDREEAGKVISRIERWQDYYMEKYGTHLVHASDEWYILAGREVPGQERYDGYLQLENGVGMIRLLTEEVHEALRNFPAGTGKTSLINVLLDELEGSEYEDEMPRCVCTAPTNKAVEVIALATWLVKVPLLLLSQPEGSFTFSVSLSAGCVLGFKLSSTGSPHS